MSNVPKLRFTEGAGEDYPEWVRLPLSKVANKVADRNGDFQITNVITNSAIKGLIKQRDYFDKDIANDQNINNYFIINYGDFVYNPRRSNEAPYGPIKMFKSSEPGIVSPIYLCFRLIKEATIKVNFLAYYFCSNKWHAYIHYYADRGARHDRVSMQDSRFFEMKIPIPATEEQTKIADFFTLIDKIIAKQGEKVAALEQYKKGLMQKIFSREIRFKDDNGKDYPEWETYLLGDIGVFKRGSILGKQNLTDEGSPCILYGELYTKYGEIINTAISKTNYHNNTLLKSNTGDVLIPASGETATDISTASCILQDNVIIGGDINLFRSKKADGRYISYFMNHMRRKEIAQVAQGASVVHLYKNQLMTITIDLPTLPEQNIIASVLTLFDKKIEKENEKLESLREQKKGLLQQLFV